MSETENYKIAFSAGTPDYFRRLSEEQAKGMANGMAKPGEAWKLLKEVRRPDGSSFYEEVAVSANPR